VDERIDTDRISGFDMGDLPANGLNSPGAVAAKNMWKDKSAVGGASKLEIDAIDCGRE